MLRCELDRRIGASAARAQLPRPAPDEFSGDPNRQAIRVQIAKDVL